MTNDQRTLVAAAVILGTFGLAVVASQSPGPPPPELAITGYEIVGSVPVSAALDDYTLRVRVTHWGRPGGAGASHVVARIASRNLSVQIVDPDATLPNLRPGTTRLSDDTITVRKPRGVPLNQGHVLWTVTGVRDAVVPEGWAGTWHLQMTYRDATSGERRSIETATNVIRSEEAFGLAAAMDVARCAVITWANTIDLQCSMKVRDLTCSGDGTGRLSLTVDGDSMTGSGAWSGTASAGCAAAGQDGETIEITGARLSTDTTTSGPTGSSLLAKFSSHIWLLPFLEVPQ